MITKRRHRNAGESIIHFNLPPGASRELAKMGLTGEWRKLKRAARGDSPTVRATDRMCPSTTKLSAVFRSVSPKVSPKLFGRIVATFWESLYYAVVLSESLHDMTRIKGRSRRHDLKLLLEIMQEGALAGQRRQIEGLRRDIPRLLKQLEPRNSHPGKRRRSSA